MNLYDAALINAIQNEPSLDKHSIIVLTEQLKTKHYDINHLQNFKLAYDGELYTAYGFRLFTFAAPTKTIQIVSTLKELARAWRYHEPRTYRDVLLFRGKLLFYVGSPVCSGAEQYDIYG